MKFRSGSTALAVIGDWPRPTTQELIRHAKRHGLDDVDAKGVPRDKRARALHNEGARWHYPTYRRLASDSLVEVAFDHLDEESYAQFVSAIGYDNFRESARKDWREARAFKETD